MKNGHTSGIVVSPKVGPRSIGQWQLSLGKRRPGEPPSQNPPPGTTHHAVFRDKDGEHLRDAYTGVSGLTFSQ